MALIALHWKRVMSAIMFVGICLVVAGISMALFTDLLQQGVGGVRLIALLIGAGLLLLIPSKVFITLLLMMGEDNKY